MNYELPKLPYSYDALEPFIDARTMEVHHSKHHAGYVAKLNAALESYPDLKNKRIEELLSDLEAVPQEIRIAVKNSGGGHYNHSLFWNWMIPQTQTQAPEGVLLEVINRDFGSFEVFKKKFSEAAGAVFGSGWAWLVKNKDGFFSVMATANQDSPISLGLKPVLGIDVWEHAYYLKHENRRNDYIEAWWNVVNWDELDI